MICRVADGYLAVQVTIGKQHDAATKKIRTLVRHLDLQNCDRLPIVYAVPKSRCGDVEERATHDDLFQGAPLVMHNDWLFAHCIFFSRG